MHKLIQLIKWEYLIQNRINNLSKYLFIFFLFCIFSTALINDQTDIKKFGIIFSIIVLPIALIGFSSLIFQQDVEDGSLELLLSSFNESEIIAAKLITIIFSSLTSALLNMPIIYIIFDLDMLIVSYLLINLTLLLILSSSLLVLIGAVQSYFRSNTNLLAILIMPLLIPNIILSGLVLQNFDNINLIFVMIGINMLLVPIIFYLSSYLIKNIYNI
ncbi:MAG: heme exporter protein CcmB [Rickettsia endosymbiont of Culicoides impunctatus]|uniref:heme exporter protein CcmB n=1 Tax=Candidatus Tisiphia endosymbiont of Sialis lutaria TaxID=2029164 RepID=UPI001E707039|nr:heme exporter protein CcmB [Rickettsia endosymbiont of Platyusa sonomae]UCM86006.1 MAG: heme exporter protein CcmB [Rickettsia endosymbiont of Culicoides impunctatus]